MESPVLLRVQPYEYCSSDRDGSFSLRIYTHTPDNPETGAFAERVLIRVEDCEPFCRMELPSIVDGKKVTWNDDALGAYALWIRNTLGHHQPTRIDHQMLQKTVYYKGGAQYPFFVCHFQTEEAMRHCVNLINKQGYQVENLGLIKSRIWETSISQIHKFVTNMGIGYGQWIDVKAHKVAQLDKISRCEREYIASWKEIKPAPEEETKNLKVSPIISAIDIECYSKNHRAFPNKDYVEDVVFQISLITQRLNHPKTRVQELLVTDICDDIPGATVHRYKHEIEMIDGVCELINERDPSVITGYNTAKFDFPYLKARMDLYRRDWRPCGLILDQPSSIKVKSWESKAYGRMKIASLEAEGRLCVDMFTIVFRDHKLSQYTLDNVGKHFLKRGKHDVKAKEMFEIHAECRAAKTEEEIKIAAEKMRKVGAYCLEDSCLCIDLFECPQLSVWVAITELANAATVTPLETFTQGQQLRVQNLVYQYAYQNGFVIDDRAGSKDGFTGGKVQDPIPGRYKNILIFDFASLYPSIIRAFNICYTTLVPPESDIPDGMCHIMAWTEEDKYHRYRFIKQEYYVGILPRICEQLTMKRAAVRKKISPDNDPSVNNKYNQQQDGLKKVNNSIFGSLGVSEGRLPLPEGARTITAFGRQLITIAANYVREKHKGTIVYGDTDSIMVDLGITDPTECIKRGEELSKEITKLYPSPLSLEFERAYRVAFFIKKKMYAGIPLCMIRFEKGDTLEQLPLESEEENLYRVVMKRNGKTETKHVAIPKTVKICPELNGKMTVIQSEKGKEEVTFEGGAVGRQTIAGTPVSEKGGPDPNQLVVKGIVLARRDNCPWIREVYKDVLIGIMFGRTMKETMDVIDSEIIKMLTRQVPFQKLLVTKGIGSIYKPNSTYFMKIFMDEMKSIGISLQAGERIDYLFVKSKDPDRNDKLAHKMRMTDQYWEKCEEEPIDRIHYVDKVMKNSIQQIFYLAYKNQVDESEAKYTPKPKRRNKLYTYLRHDYINSWMKVIKEKEKTNELIKGWRPHWPSQSPAFELAFA